MKILLFLKGKISRRLVYYIKVIISRIENIFYYNFRNKLFVKQEKMGLENIPIFIISYNRLSYLKIMIDKLADRGKSNIIIIDNASTYPPLLEYYKQIPYKIIYLDKNEGHMVFWNNPKFQKYRKNFYIISDPDIIPVEECPADFIEQFFKYLKKYPFVRKVGFSLKIDDIPRNNDLYNEIIQWEAKYNIPLVNHKRLCYAGIDTTFALYIPDQLVRKQSFYSAFRTTYPYQAKHLPWYKNSSMITEEDIFYSQHKTNGWWDITKQKVTPDNEKEYLNTKL